MRHYRNTTLATSTASLALAFACSSEPADEASGGREQSLEGGAAGAPSGGAAGAAAGSGNAGAAAADPAAGASAVPALPAVSPDAGSAAGVFFLQQVADSEAGPVSFLAAAAASTLDELDGVDAAALGLSVPGDSPAAVHGTSVFLASSDEPTISRFDLGANGQLVAGPSLSFASLGVLDVFYWRVIIASDIKAYLFDSENGRAIAWNPATMELTGAEIDISESEKPGFTLDPLAYYGRVVGGTLFVPASWYSDDEFASLGTAALYAVDIASDTLLEFSEDTRCPGYMLAALPSGELHVLPDNLFAEELGLGTDASACSVRVAAGGVGIDPDFSQDLGALVASAGAAPPRFVQGGISDGNGGIYLGAAAPAEAAGDAGAAEGELAYSLFRWDVAAGAASAVPGLSITGALVEHSNGAPPSFALQPAADLASTRILGLSASPADEVSVAGNVVAFARLR